MCLIIHKPAGQVIAPEIVRSAYRYNSDGFGIMCDGQAEKYADLKPTEIIKKLDKLQDKEIAVHFRMATHGEINKKNAHPFKLNNRAWLMHNGVLSKYAPDKSAKHSDTRQFVDQFCNKMIAKHGSIPRADLEKEIVGNAICIMQRDGTVNRYGSSWLEYEGSWYSNTYAWDYPETTAYQWRDLYGDYDSIADMSGDGDYISYSAGSDATGDYILDKLLPIVDSLPLNVPDYISYDDMHLWDELLAGYMDEYDFLGSCTATTLVAIYSYAVDRGYVAY